MPTLREPCDALDEAVELVVAVVVVHRGANELVDPARVEVEPRRRCFADRDVDAPFRERTLDLRRRMPSHCEGHDRAERLAAVGDGDAGNLDQPRAEARGEVANPLPGRIRADVERVVGGDAEADLARVVGLPVLEAARVVADR